MIYEPALPATMWTRHLYLVSLSSHHADETSISGLFAAPFSMLKVKPISGSNVGGEREIQFPAFWSLKERPVSSSSYIHQHRAVFHSEGQGTAVLALRWPRD